MTEVSKPFRFKIALSFPGEHRTRVRRIAELLANRFGKEKILYDEWHREEFARPNLDTFLPKLYHEESQLIVFFFGSDYAQKEWCGLEWRAGRDLLKHGEDDRLMFLRLDDGAVQGIYSIDGYIDISRLDDTEVAFDVLKRSDGLNRRNSPEGKGSTLLSAPSTSERTSSRGILEFPEYGKYFDQLKKLPDTEILRSIWAQPYWRICICPWEFKSARFRNVEHCRAFMLEAPVPVKGWPSYPWFSANSIELGTEWVAAETDQWSRTERWSLFQSGQFVHNRAFDKIGTVKDGIHVFEVLDTVTGAFEFASRMARANALGARAVIQFWLHGVAGHSVIWPEDMYGYKDAVDGAMWCQDKDISAETTISTAELTTSGRESALNLAVEVFAKLGWLNPRRDQLTRVQNHRFGA